jgi:Reverse transcriptase (RNA-dependent DNA polymerase)/gag-polypeptide of LTR copia-type/Integrase core domain/GAG-pre-integrase domain
MSDSDDDTREVMSTRRNPPLGDTNYSTWKERTIATLQGKGLAKYVLGTLSRPGTTKGTITILPTTTGKDGATATTPELKTEELITAQERWDMKDAQARSLIFNCISDFQMQYVQSLPTSKQVWDKLAEVHEKTGLNSRLRLIRLLFNTKYEEGASMQKHLMALHDIQTRMAAMGKPIDDDFMVTILLNSLPDTTSWQAFSAAISASMGENTTVASISNAMLEEYRRTQNSSILTGDNDNRVMYGATNQQGRPKKGVPQQDRKTANKPTCSKCGKTGHIRDDCWQIVGYPPSHKLYRASKQQDGKRNHNANNQAYLASNSDTETDDNIVATVISEFKMDTTAATESLQALSTIQLPSTQSITTGTSTIDSSNHDHHHWYIDSGATHHYCRHRHWFDTLTPVDGKTLSLGDGHRVPVQGLGTVRIQLPARNGGKRTTLILTNVHYAPDLAFNLLAVSSLQKAGLSVIFNETCTIQTRAGRTLAAASQMKNQLWRLTALPIQKQFKDAGEMAMTAQSAVTLNLWHQRLGHLNIPAVTQLLKHPLVADPPTQLHSGGTHSSTCEACIMGKQARTPLPSAATTRATHPLELVHVDLWGPAKIPSLQGARYFILVVDDHSRYMWIKLLKHKSDALDAFKEYVAYAENFHQTQGYRVSRLRSDNGGEFTSNKFNLYLQEHGIQRELTAAHTPQQNGVTERRNRVVVESALSMLYSAALPPRLWGAAMTTAVYIRNRSPTSALTLKTPFEAWTGNKPTIAHLRRFGCVAYAQVPSSTRSKLENKSLRCIFVGYDFQSRTYLLYRPGFARLIRSRDVIFDETVNGSSKCRVRNGGDSKADSNWEPFYWPPSALGLSQTNKPVSTTESTATHSPRPTSEDHKLEHIEEQFSTDSLNDFDDIPSPGSIEEDEEETPPVNQHSSGPLLRELKLLADHNPPGPRDNAPSMVNQPSQSHTTRRNRSVALLTTAPPIVSTTMEDPVTLREAYSRPDADQWKLAAQSEMDSIYKAGTWALVRPPHGCNIIDCRFVWKLKRGPNGEPIKYKARLVAKGFTQRYGIDFDETFAPVALYTSIRALLSLAAYHDWELHQMDVKSAYLNGDLDIPIYMRQPEGFVVPGKEDHVCQLKKSLYGLKQAGRTWHRKIDVSLKNRGFHALHADYCVYVRHQDSHTIIIALYVDDLLLASDHLPSLEKFKRDLTKDFDMEDLGEASFLLGISIERDRQARTVSISQPAYINTLLQRHGMADCNAVSTPMDEGARFLKSEGQAAPEEVRAYQVIIGGLTFAAICTRPDISFAVNSLSRFASNPDPSHVLAAKRVLRYLRGTVNYKTIYNGNSIQGNSNPTIVGYCDSDWGMRLEDRRSTTGYVFTLCGGAISWQSKHQRTVALSTVEAEYMAATHACKEAVWWRSFLRGLGYDVSQPTIIYSDNQGSIALTKNPEHHQKTKHIDIQYHFIREKVMENIISLQYIKTGDMMADVLTKPLGRLKFVKALTGFGLHQGLARGEVLEKSSLSPEVKRGEDCDRATKSYGGSSRMYSGRVKSLVRE